jgi:hypothetical protein
MKSGLNTAGAAQIHNSPDAYTASSQNALGKIPVVREAPPVQAQTTVKTLFMANGPLTLAKFSVTSLLPLSLNSSSPSPPSDSNDTTTGT